jgi:hypothetical protein
MATQSAVGTTEFTDMETSTIRKVQDEACCHMLRFARLCHVRGWLRDMI